MHSARKSTKVLSALSMAAVSVIGLNAGSASGATISLFYGDDSYANSNNVVATSTVYRRTSTTTDATGNKEYFATSAGVTTQVSVVRVSQTAPTTINLPIGAYLSLAIDALITGDPNPDGGKATGPNDTIQPSFLGLSDLGVSILSSDTNAAVLSPVGTGGPYSIGANGGTTYLSTGIVNNSQNGLHMTAQENNGGAGSYNIVPTWVGQVTPGTIEPNKLTGLGSDTGNTASGNIGVNSFPFGGNNPPSATSPRGDQSA